jgi:hypothetical protein
MAIIKAINSKSSISKIINYVADKEKTSKELMYGKDCSSEPSQAIEDMKMTKELYNKNTGRQYKHFVQSFSPEDDISPEKANRIGREWAEKAFKGYEVFIATHTDKDHIHNHFIVNSVNFENGEKYRQSKLDLQKYKEINDKICEREHISLSEAKKEVITNFNIKKHKAIEKGLQGQYKSYMVELRDNIINSMSKSKDKEQFILLMNEIGYKVNWSDTRKNITYTTPENKKVRDTNLAKTFKDEKMLKEGLLNELRKNYERFRELPRDELETIKAKLKEIQNYRAEVFDVMQKLKNLKREKEQPLVRNQQNRKEIENLKIAIQKEQEIKQSLGFFKFREKRECDNRIQKYTEQLERLESQLLNDDRIAELTKEINEVQEKMDIADKQYHKYDKKSNELLEKEFKIKQERKYKNIELQNSKMKNRRKDLGYER